MTTENEPTQSRTYYVYIIKTGPFIKIGHTKNIDRRLEQINTCNPYPAEVIAMLPFKGSRQAQAEEKHFHRKLEKHHVKGEWFRAEGLRLALRHDLAGVKDKQGTPVKSEAKWQNKQGNPVAQPQISNQRKRMISKQKREKNIYAQGSG